MKIADMRALVGSHDIVFITLDTLRYDVAQEELSAGRTPHFAELFPEGWEERHSPGSFTYAAHHAFFAGFLPTPATPGGQLQPRHFAAAFPGSETTGPGTLVTEEATLVEGLAARGYRTLCIGGTGFFNQLSALGRVLPGLFQESHWSRELGVSSPDSTRLQFELASRRLPELPPEQRVFLFINISAIHQPNRFYVPGKEQDDLESHAAALRYVDGCLPILLNALRRRGPCALIVCSDHGTLYGEDGFTGHRIGHPLVYTVPYAEAILPPAFVVSK